MALSITFAKQYVREIGLYDSVLHGSFPIFRRGTTVALFQSCGTWPDENRMFMSWVSASCISEFKFVNILLWMWSGTMALLFRFF